MVASPYTGGVTIWAAEKKTGFAFFSARTDRSFAKRWKGTSAPGAEA
jgi:hypothetical protein